jgi:hypothetical protein
MLLSAAKRNRHALFYGADLDLTCCKMSLVNMMLNSLTGEIAHMNSLSNEFFTGFKTQPTLVDGFHIPFYTELREPELSRIWLHPLKGNDSKQKFDKPLHLQKQFSRLMACRVACFKCLINYNETSGAKTH